MSVAFRRTKRKDRQPKEQTVKQRCRYAGRTTNQSTRRLAKNPTNRHGAREAYIPQTEAQAAKRTDGQIDISMYQVHEDKGANLTEKPPVKKTDQ